MALFPALQLPAARDWIFSARTFLAGMLALYIALQMDLPRPYWAMVTVYIVSQPLAGMARSKGLYRILGTVCGAIFSVAAIPTLVNAPELLVLAVASWIGICLYLSLMDGTPRAYAFILAGYTSAIIGFASVDAPQDMFDTAVARSEEIILGILCVLAVSYLPFGQRVGPLLQQRLDKWVNDAKGWAGAVLGGSYGGWSGSNDVQRLMADAVDIDALQAHARYDTPELRRAETAVFQLQGRMQQFFSTLLSIDDTQTELREKAPEIYAEVAPLLAETGDWVTHCRAAGDALSLSLRQRLSAQMDTYDSALHTEGGMLARSLLGQVRLLIKLWDSCLELQGLIRAGRPAPLRYRRPARHRESRFALLSALACFVSILVTATFWILAGWPEGGSACTQVAILCCFFAALDNPAAAARGWLYTSIIGTAVGGIYMFLLLPQVETFAGLAACLSLLMLPLAAMMAIPAQNGLFLPLLINCLTLVTIQSRYTLNIETFFNSAVALCLGSGAAVVTLRLAGSGGAAKVVERLIRAGRHDLLGVARGSRENADAFIGRMADRISRLLARAPLLTEDAGPAIRRLLRQMQIGLQMMRLQQLRRHRLPPAVSLKLQRLMETLDHYFASDALSVDDGIAVIEAAITQLQQGALENPLHQAEREALTALSRMRAHLRLVNRPLLAPAPKGEAAA